MGVCSFKRPKGDDMANILVIDDDDSTCDLLQKTLPGLGHSVITAKNGVEGFEKAFWRKADVILLDIVMPEESGLELLARLKKSRRTQHIPVLMLTGYDDEEYRTQSSEEYADYYIVKPSSPSAISEKIEKTLKESSVTAPPVLARLSQIQGCTRKFSRELADFSCESPTHFC